MTATALHQPRQAPLSTPHLRVRNGIRRLTGIDLLPDAAVRDAFADGLRLGDPVAERFVAETYHGELGARRARALLERALTSGVASVADAPESMRALFAEFEQLPSWADPALIEQGAAVWRRWGYELGAVGNAGTMDTYTEASLALPLSLAGGYAGDRALHRYLETTRWWLEVSRPDAILTPGSRGRAISMHVRVMHVSVRARVARHREWDGDRWGVPISQSEMLLTLLAGSVAPALALYALGYLTSPREIRAVLHFNRYLGHLLGVRCDDFFPETVLDAVRLLFLWDATRACDAGSVGAELVESFVPAFRPREHHHGINRMRAYYHYWLQAGYSGLFMFPWNRRRYDLPSPLPGIDVLLARAQLAPPLGPVGAMAGVGTSGGVRGCRPTSPLAASGRLPGHSAVPCGTPIACGGQPRKERHARHQHVRRRRTCRACVVGLGRPRGHERVGPGRPCHA
jgi:hypothetical protein